MVALFHVPWLEWTAHVQGRKLFIKVRFPVAEPLETLATCMTLSREWGLPYFTLSPRVGPMGTPDGERADQLEARGWPQALPVPLNHMYHTAAVSILRWPR